VVTSSATHLRPNPFIGSICAPNQWRNTKISPLPRKMKKWVPITGRYIKKYDE